MKPILEFGENLNWNYVFRERFDAQPDPLKQRDFLPIPDTVLQLSYRILLIGISSIKAKPHWQRGAVATTSLLFSPSSTSILPAEIEVFRKTCYLGRFTLLDLPAYEPLPYQLRIRPFHWLPDIALEVWYYDGIDSDTTTEALARIESKVDYLR